MKLERFPTMPNLDNHVLLIDLLRNGQKLTESETYGKQGKTVRQANREYQKPGHESVIAPHGYRKISPAEFADFGIETEGKTKDEIAESVKAAEAKVNGAIKAVIASYTDPNDKDQDTLDRREGEFYDHFRAFALHTADGFAGMNMLIALESANPEFRAWLSEQAKGFQVGEVRKESAKGKETPIVTIKGFQIDRWITLAKEFRALVDQDFGIATPTVTRTATKGKVEKATDSNLRALLGGKPKSVATPQTVIDATAQRKAAEDKAAAAEAKAKRDKAEAEAKAEEQRKRAEANKGKPAAPRPGAKQTAKK
jgi:hypothetical protein